MFIKMLFFQLGICILTESEEDRRKVKQGIKEGRENYETKKQDIGDNTGTAGGDFNRLVGQLLFICFQHAARGARRKD